MPAPVIGGAITAAGQLGGAIFGSKSADKASKANLQAQQEALQFEREREARRQKEYDDAMAMHKAQMDAWNANRRSLLARYGINVAGPAGAGGGPPGGGGVNLGSLVGRGPSQGSPMAASSMPPAAPMDLENWNDWSRYAAV